MLSRFASASLSPRPQQLALCTIILNHEMKRSHPNKAIMDPFALHKRLRAIVEVEIPQFTNSIRQTRLPIMDMADIQSTGTSNDVAGLRKFAGDLMREIKALEKVLMLKLAFHPTHGPHSYTRLCSAS